jgi:hypothetical protein
MLVIPYNYLERVRLLVAAHNGRILNEAFAADIAVTGQFAVEAFPDFQRALEEMSHGSLAAEVVATNEATIMP